MEKTFCEECRKDVEYLVQTKEMIGKIKGEEYCYIGKEATCADCGAYVYVAQINDENLESLYDEYRKKNNIISLSTIRELPNKYAIGKRPLSLLLRWGEQTFSRFYDGDIPTKQYSEMLLRLYNEPVYFSELLETNKDNLKSILSYEKSRKAVDEE